MSSQVAVIRATLKYSTQEELIRGMGPLITKRGMFIHTRNTRPVGAEVQFEFHLADNSQTYTGEGIVRREIPYEEGPAAQKSGMLIALRRVNRAFKEVVDAVLNERENREAAAEQAKEETPQESASPAPRHVIVETHGGEGFDLFGDMDMDMGLDSMFSSIEKSPSSPVQHHDDGMNLMPMTCPDEPEEEDLFAGVPRQSTKDAPVYQDTPTPRPDTYIPAAEAFRDDPLTQKRTGEFEAVEYIAEAERQVYLNSQDSAALSEDAIRTAENLDSILNAPYAPADNASGMDIVSGQTAQADTEMPTQENLFETQQVMALKGYDREGFGESDQTVQTEPVSEPASELDSIFQQPSPTERRFAPRSSENNIKTPSYSTLSGFPSQLPEASPSELFAALHDDILGEQEDSPAPAPAVHTELKLTSVEEITSDSVINTPVTAVHHTARTNRETEASAAQAELPPSKVNKEPATLESLLKRAEIKAPDIIMTDVTTKKAVPRRRNTEELQLNVPTQAQKGGIFSKLFKK